MSSVEIVSEMKSLTDLLLTSSSMFSIPDFQRNFVWTKKNVEAMLSDFYEDTEGFTKDSSELEGYLLGNIVLISKQGDNEKIVIDGQQRLTTLSLLFKALDVVGTKKISINTDFKIIQKWMNRISDLNKGYKILNDEDEFKSLRIVHSPSLNFGKYYKKLICDDLQDFEPIAASDINIKDVYDCIQEYLEGLNEDQISKLIIYLKTKVKLIVTSAPTESKAFQLFEVLNDRGRSLEPMDLIKNNFIKRLNNEGKLETQIQDFNNNWKSFVDNLIISPKRQISSSTFMRYYLIAFEGVNVKQEQLFDYFKSNEKVYNGEKILTLAKNLNKYSKIYASIEKKDYSVYLDNNINMNVLFGILGVKQMHPLLMVFYNEAEEKKKEVLDLAVRFAASVIFSYTQTNFIETKITSLISKYLSIKDKDVAYVTLRSEMEFLIKDKAKLAQTIIASKDFTSQSGGVQTKAFDLLKFVECYFNENTLVLAPQPGRRLSVEHILSRNLDLDIPSEAEFDSYNERKEHLNRIGNLTILYNTDNSALGNKKFVDKIDLYKDCDFKMTKCIISPLLTKVKAGKDTKLYEKINKVEKSYDCPTDGHWTKSRIIERSNDFAFAVYCILTQDFNF